MPNSAARDNLDPEFDTCHLSEPWQMDLKKLPHCQSFGYVCNIIGCYSKFAMGAAVITKSAKKVCSVIVSFMYRYGTARILQTDNGKEFNNAALLEVTQEMKALKINSRPYHPQSQGRVECCYQAMAKFLRSDLRTH